MAIRMWPSKNGVQITDGPVWQVNSAEIITGELGQFEASTFNLNGSDRRAIQILDEFTFIEVEMDDVGTIFSGYVINPQQDITENGDHTISLPLEPLIDELRRRRTGRFWKAATWLSQIFNRLAGIIGTWEFSFVGPPDSMTSVSLMNPNLLSAVLGIAKDAGHWVRLATDATGAPIRKLEIGQFGEHSGIWFTSANGANPTLMREYITNRLVASITRKPNDVTNFMNVCIPLGGGNDAESIVTLERAWRMINDPKYIHYGRYGTDAESMARTGRATVANIVIGQTIDALALLSQPTYASTYLAAIPVGEDVGFISTSGGWSYVTWGSVTGYVDARFLASSLFPDYDPNYPISDPLNPSNGYTTWGFLDPYGNQYDRTKYFALVFPRQADNTVPVNVYDYNGAIHTEISAALDQGATGTRRTTVDGHRDYVMYDLVSYATYPYVEGEYTDSTIVSPDANISNQELASVALYVACKTEFLHRAHPHHSVQVVVDAVDYPPKPGDLVDVDFQRLGSDEDGTIIEMNVVETLKVMKTTRSYPAMKDTVLLSNTGKFDQDDSSSATDDHQTIITMQMREGSSIAPYPMCVSGNVDALHPLTVYVMIPPQLFQWVGFRVRVDFLRFTGTAKTADSLTQSFQIFSPATDILLDTGSNSLDLVGGTHNGTGYVSNLQSIPNFPVHFHQIPIYSAGNPVIPSQNTDDSTHTSKWTYVFSAQNVFRLTANNSGPGILETNASMNRQSNPQAIDLSVMNHTGVTPLNKTVRGAFATIARIAGQTILANLPAHSHLVTAEIPDGLVAPNCSMSINGIDLSSGAGIASGTRNADGTFPSSFELQDVSEWMQHPGQTIPLVFTPGTSAGNLKGVGRFQVTLCGFGQWGGFQSTFRVN